MPFYVKAEELEEKYISWWMLLYENADMQREPGTVNRDDKDDDEMLKISTTYS